LEVFAAGDYKIYKEDITKALKTSVSTSQVMCISPQWDQAARLYQIK
jgi:hypothetical protein